MATYGTNSVTLTKRLPGGSVEVLHHFGTGHQELVFHDESAARHFAENEGVPLSDATQQRITQRSL